jgi:hypothetical protein
MFDIYKPFRNRLRKRSVVESLYAVFRFIQFLEFDIALPRELAPPPIVTLRPRMSWGLYQWEFEILAREIILNGDRHAKSYLSSWGEVAKEINAIKSLENETWGKHARREGDVLYELVRIAHRQFPWQKGLNQPHIALYSRLYEDDGLAEMIRAEYSMSHSEILQLSMALSGHFLKEYAVNIPLRNEINSASQEVCDAFVMRFSLTLDELRDEYRAAQAFDINWAYTFNPLRSKPLIRISSSQVICPIPAFLLRRATSEIYYDLVRHEAEFARHFGPAVQSLVGEIARRADHVGNFNIIPEERYGSRRAPKDTVDWIVVDETASLFVECKAARVRHRGISDLTDRQFIDSEFDRIRAFTVQLYKSLNSALHGEYPNWQPDGRPVYPIIVTLEDWQTFGIHIQSLVIDPLKTELKSMGIEPEIVDRHPPSFCAIDTFDMAMNVCNIVGIEQVFAQKTQGEYPQWALEVFLMTHFGEELGSRLHDTFAEQWIKLERDR